MKIVIAPDKFKGSLAADRVAAAIAAGLRAELPAAELVRIPVADGGDGTVDAAVAAGLERVPVTVAGPTGEPVAASYARRGEVAVIELACACGLAQLPGGRREPLAASSFGAGQVLAAALETGARRIIFGVGAGAAGGVGFAALAVLGAEPRSGIAVVLELAGFEAALDGAALVITGEGSLDAQSLAGKTPVGVARAAARRGIPVIAVAGRCTLTGPELTGAGIAAVYPLSDLEPDPARSSLQASALLERVGRMMALEVQAAARP